MRRSTIIRKNIGELRKHGSARAIRVARWFAAGLLVIGIFHSSAAARGFISLHFGVPLVVGPPVYYAPPPVYYVPPPVVYAPPPPPPETCQEYQTTATIGGTPHQVVGTACLQPDGTWRMTQ